MAAAAQQFKQPLVIPTGSWPAGIVAADLNGDGKADLIYTDYGATATASTTHVLLNNGDGTFTTGQTIATAGAAIAAADFDHDGHVDLAWVWGTVGLGKAYLARGNGDGTFAAAEELGTFAIVGTNAPVFSYVLGAQLHDTGYLDLLVEDVANPSLLTLTTDSSGILVRIVGTKLQSGTGPMVAADLNGDGHTDLAIQSVLGGTVSGGTADVFLGSADGLLTAAGTYAGSTPVQSMLLHDVDGDGHLDLVLEGANGRIEILHGNTDGSFATTSEGGSGSADATTGMGGHLVAVTDLGGRHNFYTTTPAGMSVLLGQGDLSLSLQGIYNAGPGRTSFAVADFNGDGVLDVAVDSPEGVAILFGNADGGLGSSRAFAAGKPALSGALGNFSGSGNLDAVVNVAAAQALLLHGNGDGTFAALATPIAQASAVAVVAQVGSLQGAPQIAGMVQAAEVTADLDGDGNADVIVAYDNASADHAHPNAASANAIYIWYGKSDGTFAAPVAMTPSRNFYQLAAVDLNGDGRPDLVMSDGYVVSVQNNLGGRAFGVEEHFLAGMGINSISAGDVNKDGFTDLVIANGGAVLSNAVIGQKTTAGNTDVNTGGITVLLNTPKAIIPTTTVLTITSPLTITFGQEVDGTAQVTASDGSLPTGTISFFDGATNICTIAVAPSASCPASAGSGFAVGTHVLTAVYSGDTTHLGSSSVPVTVVVLPVAATKAQTVTTLTSSANPVTSGQSVTFTANVVATGSSVVPTGIVAFLDGSTVLGTKTLVGSGVASFIISSLSVGVHAITASYAGDANSVASVSSVLTETVTGTVAAGDSFSVSVTGAAKVGVGGVASLQVAVAPQTGYMQPVQLSCADLPSESACTFAAHTIPAGGGTTTLQLSTMAPRSCAVADSGTTTAGLPFAGTVAALLVLFIPGKRRRAIEGLLVALIALCGMATLSGCGACTDLGTKPGSYTIRVIGTSGASVVTTKVQVTVSVE